MAGTIDFGALDTRIPAQAAQSFNVLGAYQAGQDDRIKRQAAEQGQQMNALQLQKATRSMAAEEQVRNVLAQNGGRLTPETISEVMKVDPTTALAYQKQLDEQKKAGMEQELTAYKVSKNSMDMVSAAPDQSIFEVAKQEVIKNGQIFGKDPAPGLQHLEQLYAQGGPQAIRSFTEQAAMTAKDRFDQKFNQEKFSYQQQNDAIGHGLTAQGQRMAQENSIRTNDRLSQALGAGNNKPPSGYRVTANGDLEPIPGGPGDKSKDSPGRILPATRIEELADMERVQVALKEAGKLAENTKVETGPISGRLQSLGSKVGLASNDFVNVQQKFATAENIMLKLRSGAAVTDQEYERFKREYPTVNDPPEVRKIKLANAVKYASDLLDEKKAMYAEGGYKVPNRGGSGIPSSVPPAIEPPAPPEEYDYSRAEAILGGQ